MEGIQFISVSIEGKPALVCYDHEFLFVVRGHSKTAITNPDKAYLRVPLALVLHASFVSDSDGGSLLVRLLSPPIQKPNTTAFPFFTKAKETPECIKSLVKDKYEFQSDREKSERLRQQLDGHFFNLRLFKLEARITTPDEDNLDYKAEEWVDEVMSKAYRNVKPFRRIKVLVNPAGGPGKAKQLFESRVRPILEAASCKLDVSYTTHRNHGLEIAHELDIESFDLLTTVSGDGMIHEVVNGFATREDAAKALRIPIAPIPTGSGNAMAINLLGPQNGLSLALACLNIIKGRPLNLDLLTVTQPASAFPPGSFIPGTSSKYTTSGAGPSSNRDSDDAALITETPIKPFIRYYSFLSQAIGLMADIDLGTENLRSLGDTRFLIGYATGVLKNNKCELDVDVKLGSKGTTNKSEMRENVREFIKNGSYTMASADGATERAEDEKQSLLQHGAVTDPLVEDRGSPPPLDMSDPSWANTLILKHRKSAQQALNGASSDQSTGWFRMQEPLVSLYGGKVPFVGRDLMQFPYALPGDGTIDLAVMMHGGGRASQLPEMGAAENGKVVYQKSMGYLKVEAFRVKPRYPEGDRRLSKGGMISIDGEKVPYAPFQVEVAKGRNFSVLSLYGQFCVDLVEPPNK